MEDDDAAEPAPAPPLEARPPLAIAAAALGLFLVWSNSFVAAGWLVGAERAAAQLSALELTVARFIPVAPICGVYCLLIRRSETLAVIRAHPARVVLASLFCTPAYSFTLYWGQEHGVSAPIASVETALTPLFLMLLSAAVLGEPLSRRKVAGFVVALVGLVMIASAKWSAGGATGGGAVPVIVTALAPLSWALYSIVSKPVSGACSPITWSYLCILVGSLPLLAIAPFRGGPELLALDGAGLAALLYLSLGCTVLGFAVWTWLLRHLPASSVGFTVFLNPPLTTASKLTLATLLPGAFAFVILPLEWAGGAVVLLGLGIALIRRSGGRPPRGDAGSPSP